MLKVKHLKSIEEYAFYECTGLISVTFKETEGWYIGDSVGDKASAEINSYLVNKSAAATCLTSMYVGRYWTH